MDFKILLKQLPSDLLEFYNSLSDEDKQSYKNYSKNYQNVDDLASALTLSKTLRKNKTSVKNPPKITTSKVFKENIKEMLLKHYIYEYQRSLGMHHSKEGEVVNERELEVKFGTKGIKKITKNDYDNVIIKLKSNGFKVLQDENYMLRINSEYINKEGKKKNSSIRVELNKLDTIQEYCRTNNLKNVFKEFPTQVDFVKKTNVTDSGNRIMPINVDDFNFRFTYNNEESIPLGMKTNIMNDWSENKKTFRYINRTSLMHPDYPLRIDLSIVKTSIKYANSYKLKPVYDITDSNVFNNNETYEIEIESFELNKHLHGYDIFEASLRKAIKFVLSGLQGTNYPISYVEQGDVLKSYMRLIWEDESEKMKAERKHFIGPNSVTLQLTNIVSLDDDYQLNDINIRKDFVVTEKADGVRHMLYINETGKIYLLNQGLNVKFTGAITKNKEAFNTLIDGELITHNKYHEYINLYAAFDLYYLNQFDTRSMKFMNQETDEDKTKSRYFLLCDVIRNLNPLSVVNGKDISPIKITFKHFYSPTRDIFERCDMILTREKEGNFEYETDGLIFNHAYFGVGSNEIDKAGIKTNITWEYSFKWKPPEFNTIDFMVSTIKEETGDLVKSKYENGTNMTQLETSTSYKSLKLRCGFNESVDGYINPVQDMIDDRQFNEDENTNKMVPYQFYPTEPFDENAGICNIPLKTDKTGKPQMYTTEGNDVFFDNDIVEFSYDLTKPYGWRWVPLRVRYDKKVSNKYATANSNWKSIHSPVTERMITKGIDIPVQSVSEDKYYNNSGTKHLTDNMKNFHNLYVKKNLIKFVSNKGDTLIDYACGKGGDLSKWIYSKLSFVFGIDNSKDNIENRLNGACARYLNAKKKNKSILQAMFVNGNSGFNIKDGQGIETDKEIKIVKTIFGDGKESVGAGVDKLYRIAEQGFNISSCQFALHYFFKDPKMLNGFMTNIAQCTKLNGYFIGTAYDGKTIFNKLINKKKNETIQLTHQNKKVWEIKKEYDSNEFKDDSSSIGYKITVFQESINQYISEYLINFNYLKRVMEQYGFEPLLDQEARDIGFKSSIGSFKELHTEMMKHIKKNSDKKLDYGNAHLMQSFEKEISFLNNYFIFKKVREVNTTNVNIDIEDYADGENLKSSIDMNTRTKSDNNIKNNKTRKIIKLNKTLIMNPVVKTSNNKTKKVIKKFVIVKDDDK